jgi:anti-sigma regulatory factor (Ser/Thr protein kinase)
VSAFRHEALFYEGDPDFLARTVPFIEAGIAQGDAVLVAVPEPRLSALRTTLPTSTDGMTFADMALVGRNPGRLISLWDDFLRSQSGRHGAIRGVGEPIWEGCTEDEIAECEIHERLLDLAFANFDELHFICAYNSASLPADIVSRATIAHDHALTHSDVLSTPMRAAPAGAYQRAFHAVDIRAVRHDLADLARYVGLSASQSEDLVLAASEIVTNSVRHGGGEGTLLAWIDGDSVVCEISDRGHITDPLVGRRRPPADEEGGRGLWLAHQLCDLVQVRSDPEGTVVRLRMAGSRIR